MPSLKQPMRFVVASIVSVAILALSFFMGPSLRAKGVPMGGLAMIAISAMLAATWMLITKGVKPKPKANHDSTSGSRDGV